MLLVDCREAKYVCMDALRQPIPSGEIQIYAVLNKLQYRHPTYELGGFLFAQLTAGADSALYGTLLRIKDSFETQSSVY